MGNLQSRIKEWDQYFSENCHLPASAIMDLFDEIEHLLAGVEALERALLVSRTALAATEQERE